MFAVLSAVSWLATGASAAPPRAYGNSIRVELELETGGSLAGIVVDHTPHGLVVIHDGNPYVFAWKEVSFRTAYVAKRDLLALRRGGREQLTGEDHYELGLFALFRGRSDLAAREFRKATSRDAGFSARARAAFDEYRSRRKDRDKPSRDRKGAVFPPEALPLPQGRGSEDATASPLDEAAASTESDPGLALGRSADSPVSGTVGDAFFDLVPTTEAMHERAREVYRAFDAEVARVIGKGVTLLETEHFLIWTDWRTREHPRLINWSEAAYRALCEQFDLHGEAPVFLAKCPLFCWRSKIRFRKFAEHFDAHRGENLVGYTRSIEKNGHVHIVLLRQGPSEADFDRFAATLVHEATHAFLHRLYSTKLIPNWVNEGYADMIAARVLGDRCPNRENANLLARQYVRHGWPIGRMLDSVGPIGVQEYPLAHSIVAYLATLGRGRLTGFIRSLKAGRQVPEALAVNFDGLSLQQLEADWRRAVAGADPRAREFPAATGFAERASG